MIKLLLILFLLALLTSLYIRNKYFFKSIYHTLVQNKLLRIRFLRFILSFFYRIFIRRRFF